MQSIARVFLGLGLIAVPLVVLAAGNASKAVQAKVEVACENRVRAQLVAPMDAKVIPSTKTHGTSLSDHVTQVYDVCLQARTQGGGYRLVKAQCLYDTTGTILSDSVGDGDTICRIMMK
jgi:hypothetical protein